MGFIRFVIWAVALAWVSTATLSFAQTNPDASRVALVIGNSSYEHTSTLPNPERDAQALADKLSAIGFDVMLANNLTIQTARTVLGEFSEKAENADIALVYYAGHGMEIAGTNYMIPIDATMRSESSARFEAISLDEIIYAVQSAKTLSVILLDACRNNPFSKSIRRKDATRAVSRGLSRIEIAQQGMLISYAAREGTTADDGDGEHSPYAQALLSVIGTPGLEVGFMFRQIREKVKTATNGRQEPREYSALPDHAVYFVKPGTPAPAEPEVIQSPTNTVATTPAEPKIIPKDAEVAFLEAIQENTTQAYEGFLAGYPDHPRAEDIRSLMRAAAEEREWQKAIAADTLSAYRRYLIIFPQGVFATQATQKIATKTTLAESPVIVPPPSPPVNSCQSTNGPYRVIDVPSNDKLNVRSGPGTQFSAVGSLRYNQRGIHLGACVDAKWCKIAYGCLEGYVSRKYLTSGTNTAPSSSSNSNSGYHVIDHASNDTLAVRAGPSVDNSKIGGIPFNGTDITVHKCVKSGNYRYKWCTITWRNLNGWAYARYMADNNGKRPG